MVELDHLMDGVEVVVDYMEMELQQGKLDHMVIVD
jgi:hypothetical protein